MPDPFVAAGSRCAGTAVSGSGPASQCCQTRQSGCVAPLSYCVGHPLFTRPTTHKHLGHTAERHRQQSNQRERRDLTIGFCCSSLSQDGASRRLGCGPCPCRLFFVRGAHGALRETSDWPVSRHRARAAFGPMGKFKVPRDLVSTVIGFLSYKTGPRVSDCLVASD